MRRDILGLGVALAVGSLAYGSYRVLTGPPAPSPPATVASTIAPPSPPRLRVVSAPPPRRPALVAAHVRRAAARYRVPERLVAAVIAVESEYNPRAISRRGALGLMQLMPVTAALLGVRDAFDPGENIDGGVRHLRAQLDRFGNDVTLALAAYNAGPGAVIQHGGVPPFPETRAFVARVMDRYREGPRFTAASGARPPLRVRLATRYTSDRLAGGEYIPVVHVSARDETVTLGTVPDRLAPRDERRSEPAERTTTVAERARTVNVVVSSVGVVEAP